MGRPSRLVFLILILRLATSAGSAAAAAAPVASPGPVGQAESPTWRSECVDCPVSVFEIGDRSLALDAAGPAPRGLRGRQAVLCPLRRHGLAGRDDRRGAGHRRRLPVRLHRWPWTRTARPTSAIWTPPARRCKYARRTPQGWQIETMDSRPRPGLRLRHVHWPSTGGPAAHRLLQERPTEICLLDRQRWDIQLVDAA